MSVRFNEHCRPCYDKSLLTRAILKYGRENFKIEILEDGLLKEVAFEREGELIRTENCLEPSGYNQHDNSRYSGNVHYKPKMSDKCRQMGWAARSGSKHTTEVKTRMSASAKLRGPNWTRSIVAINLITNEKIEFNSVKNAATALNINRRSISNILHGWAKKSGNFTFMIKEV